VGVSSKLIEILKVRSSQVDEGGQGWLVGKGGKMPPTVGVAQLSHRQRAGQLRMC
jgi:hypothetical protein